MQGLYYGIEGIVHIECADTKFTLTSILRYPTNGIHRRAGVSYHTYKEIGHHVEPVPLLQKRSLVSEPALIRTLKGVSFETGTFEIYNLQKKKNAAQLTLSRADASKEQKKNLSKKDNYTSASYNQQPTTTHGSPLDLAEGNPPPSPMGARRRLPLSPMGGRCHRCHSLLRRISAEGAHRRAAGRHSAACLPLDLAEGRVLPAATASPPAAARYAAASVPPPHAIACHRQETAVEKEREPRERGCERERSGGEWIRTPPHHPLSVLSSLPMR